MEAPQHNLEAPESQRKRTWAEISAYADQGSTADDGLGDVGDGDVVTLRPQISSKKVVARNCPLLLHRIRAVPYVHTLLVFLLLITCCQRGSKNYKLFLRTTFWLYILLTVLINSMNWGYSDLS